MKKIIILFLSILLTGCTVDCKITVKEDQKVEEKIVITQPNESLKSVNKNVEDTVEMYMKSYKSFFKNNKIKYSYKIGKKDTVFYLTKTYKNFDEYKNAVSFQSLYQTAQIDEEKNKTRFYNVGKYNGKSLFAPESGADFDDDINMAVKDMKIQVLFENKVLSINADEQDEKNNTYTWHINGKYEYKNIDFTISDSKRYDIIIKNIIKKNIIAITVTLTLIVAITGCALYFYIEQKRVNKI